MNSARIHRIALTSTWPVAARSLGSLAVAWVMCLHPGTGFAQGVPADACGNPFVNHFGPYDYRKADKATKDLVENNHFTPGIEAMTTPKNTMMHDMAQDVSYTLGVFPNHHRALLTMQRLSERHKVDPPPGTSRTVYCWFERATRYTPDDTVVRGLFAQYLAKHGRKPEAVQQLELAVEYAKDNAWSHFNIGLVYFDMGEYERALAQAHKALALGYTRTDLADRLKRVNRWTDPAASAASSASAGS